MAGKERKGDNQKLKMLYLVKIFSEETDDNHSLTMPQIIDKLSARGVNADRKTLYLDFEELRNFGLDIIAVKAGRSCFYHLGNRDFELPELKLLVDSVQSAKFITDKKSKELIKKLEALVSKHEGKQLHRQVIISGRIKTMNESIYYNVDKLHEAIGADSRIRFQYYQWNKEVIPSSEYEDVRIVCPEVYTFTLDDLYQAIKNMKAADPDIHEFGEYWFYPITQLSESFNLDRAQGFVDDDELIDGIPESMKGHPGLNVSDSDWFRKLWLFRNRRRERPVRRHV